MQKVMILLQKEIIPISINIFDRSFRATNAFMQENYGQIVSGTHSLIFDHIYGGMDKFFGQYRLPDVSTYLHARNYDLISDATLYCHLMEKNNLKSALELVTSVCAVYPKEGTNVAAKSFAGYRGNHMRRECEKLLGKEAQDQQMGWDDGNRVYSDVL